MKFEIQTQKIKDAVRQLERVAAKHATLPALACIFFEAKNGVLMLRATNLDIGIEISLPAKVSSPGTSAIPAHTLAPFISQLSDQGGITSIEDSSGNISIVSSQTKGVIKAISPEDFPSIPKVSGVDPVEMDPAIFIKGLKSVWYSSSVSNVKPELSSVYVYKDGEYLVFAATDSFRLAEKRIKVPASTKIDGILIPFRNISDLIRILEGATGNIKLSISKNLVAFEGEGMYVASRVIDGVFPDYKQIIPKGFITEAVALKEDVINSLKISNIFSDKFNQVKLVIDPKKKIFEIQTKNSDVGENSTSVGAALSGEAIEVNFNCKYISDCFQSIDSDSVSLQLSGTNRPMVIRPVSGEQTFTYIVMPMNR